MTNQENSLMPYLNKIINADCLEVMKGMPDNCVDLCLTDAPYGIGIDGQKKSISKNPKHNRKEHSKKDWDNFTPSQEYFDEMKRISRNQIYFGANYFNSKLDDGNKGWIVWDKGQRGLTMSDCEIIYSSFKCATRILTYNRACLIADDTFHPTQKPTKLIKMILHQYLPDGGLVFDGFSGSGTTALACHDLGYDFVCVEKDFEYWEASCKRLEEHQRQGKLF